MAITAAQKATIEDVLKAITSTVSPRKKRPLADMFLELVDREDWAGYYEVGPAACCHSARLTSVCICL